MAKQRRFELSPTIETEKRAREVQLLVNIAEPDPKYQPLLLTDEASLLDAVGIDPETMRDRFRAYFRGHVPFDMHEPAWKAVDKIRELYPDWPGS